MIIKQFQLVKIKSLLGKTKSDLRQTKSQLIRRKSDLILRIIIVSNYRVITKSKERKYEKEKHYITHRDELYEETQY